MSTPHVASLAATRLAEDQLHAWALQTFPGIVDLDEHPVVSGSLREPTPELAGRWKGTWIAFHTDLGGTHRGAVLQRCRCCGHLAPAFGTSFTNITQFARYTAHLERDVAFCFGCRWLHDAQLDAHQVKTRLGRWLFTRQRGHQPEAVLAAHQAQCDGYSVTPARHLFRRTSRHTGPSA